ncbi:MAG TPA: hypothetical protein VHH73_03435 [Verrucomicrobiae bacterium]|nr:hypothetical protein [Verrucomicrobiae bacterium]
MKTNSSALVLPAPSTNGAPSTVADIRDLKAPVVIPNGWAWLWWTLGAVAVATAAWWLWKRWLRRRAEKAAALPPPVPAHIRARLRLNEALGLIAEPRPFCIAISDALRAYLEERFSLRAPDRTTEEFLIELKTSQLLNGDQKLALADFLSRCDLVKFARYVPAKPELMDLQSAAMRLVDQTEPPLFPPPGETPAPVTPSPAAS